jgi:hypothetical protein
VPSKPKVANLSIGCDYDVIAAVLYITEKACLVDFGLRAACSCACRSSLNFPERLARDVGEPHEALL